MSENEGEPLRRARKDEDGGGSIETGEKGVWVVDSLAMFRLMLRRCLRLRGVIAEAEDVKIEDRKN